MARWPPSHLLVHLPGCAKQCSRGLPQPRRRAWSRRRRARSGGVSHTSEREIPPAFPNRSSRGLHPRAPLRRYPTPSCDACPVPAKVALRRTVGAARAVGKAWPWGPPWRFSWPAPWQRTGSSTGWGGARTRSRRGSNERLALCGRCAARPGVPLPSSHLSLAPPPLRPPFGSPLQAPGALVPLAFFFSFPFLFSLFSSPPLFIDALQTAIN